MTASAKSIGTIALVVLSAILSHSASAAEKPRQPNILFIMSDDQGYGDASSYNPDSKFPTPGIDRIANEGIRFADAHSGSAVCTPIHYGLLTVPELLKQHGYQTALVGKWHTSA